MTVEAYPGLLGHRTYGAEIIRRMFNSFLQRGPTIGSGVGGLVVATDCQIVTASSGLKVLVEPGELWVPGSYGGTTTQGSYYTRVSAQEPLTCSAAESNPRVERVVMLVKDQEYTGSENQAELALSKGTANASANISTLAACESYGGAAPINSYTLGYVLVPNTTTLAGQGGILTVADIKNTSAPAVQNALTLRQSGVNITANAGEIIESTANGLTITSPAHSAGRCWGAFCGGSAASTKLKAASGAFYGDFVNNQAEITLTTNQHILLISDGSNWLIIAGEPKREQTYVARSASLFSKEKIKEGESSTWTNPSTSRPAILNIDLTIKSEAARGEAVKALVGGVLVQELFATENNGSYEVASPLTYWVGPGEQVTLTAYSGGGSTAVEGIHASYRLI